MEHAVFSSMGEAKKSRDYTLLALLALLPLQPPHIDDKTDQRKHVFESGMGNRLVLVTNKDESMRSGCIDEILCKIRVGTGSCEIDDCNGHVFVVNG